MPEIFAVITEWVSSELMSRYITKANINCINLLPSRWNHVAAWHINVEIHTVTTSCEKHTRRSRAIGLTSGYEPPSVCAVTRLWTFCSTVTKYSSCRNVSTEYPCSVNGSQELPLSRPNPGSFTTSGIKIALSCDFTRVCVYLPYH